MIEGNGENPPPGEKAEKSAYGSPRYPMPTATPGSLFVERPVTAVKSERLTKSGERQNSGEIEDKERAAAIDTLIKSAHTVLDEQGISMEFSDASGETYGTTRVAVLKRKDTTIVLTRSIGKRASEYGPRDRTFREVAITYHTVPGKTFFVAGSQTPKIGGFSAAVAESGPYKKGDNQEFRLITKPDGEQTWNEGDYLGVLNNTFPFGAEAFFGSREKDYKRLEADLRKAKIDTEKTLRLCRRIGGQENQSFDKTQIVKEGSLTPSGYDVVIARENAKHLDEYPSRTLELVGNDWDRVRETIKQHLTDSAETRAIFLNFAAHPLDQALVRDFGLTPPVPATASTILSGFLRLPDISTRQMDPNFDTAVANGNLSRDEADILVKRHQYAKDVKMFALQAAIENAGPHGQEAGVHQLPADITVTLDDSPEKAILTGNFLQPRLWMKEGHINHRISTLEIERQPYILKEREMPPFSPQQGITSQQEYEYAKNFEENGSVDTGRFHLRWERPVGFVEFPDGYQFAIFAGENNLLDSHDVIERMAYSVVRFRTLFEGEYEDIKAQMDNYRDHSLIRRKKEHSTHQEQQDLTFEQYAIAKAYALRKEAEVKAKEKIAELGYETKDNNYLMYKIDEEQDKGPQITAIGTDFSSMRKHEREEQGIEAKEIERVSEGDIVFMGNSGDDWRYYQEQFGTSEGMKYGSVGLNTALAYLTLRMEDKTAA